MLPNPAYIADRELSRFLESFQKLDSGGLPGVFETNVLATTDKRKDDGVLDLTKATEIGGLLDKETF